MSDIGLINMLETKLTYDAERQKLLAQNIANIDTPGYKAKDLQPLDFRNVLAAQTSHIPLAATNPMHLNGGRAGVGKFRAVTSRDTFERTPTGGTVVVEEQMMKVAQNATDYQMTTGLYKKVHNLFRQALGLAPA